MFLKIFKTTSSFPFILSFLLLFLFLYLLSLLLPFYYLLSSFHTTKMNSRHWILCHYSELSLIIVLSPCVLSLHCSICWPPFSKTNFLYQKLTKKPIARVGTQLSTMICYNFSRNIFIFSENLSLNILPRILDEAHDKISDEAYDKI